MTLPALKWVASPNFSARTAHVDQIVIHDCEGGYAGSVSWFEQKQSNVSAHFVVREDGLEVTQMVELASKAWHACAFNSRSVGIEMAGFESKGFGSELLSATAAIAAYLCHHLQITVRHARAGVGPGLASHFDLGQAGGGHRDPSMDPTFMDKFVEMVAAEYAKGDFPAVWEPGGIVPAPCPLTPPHPGPEPTPVPPQPAPEPHPQPSPVPTGTYDISTTKGLQDALAALGYLVVVDGKDGPKTKAAVMEFQQQTGVLTVDGDAGPLTQAAILKALAQHTAPGA